MLDAGCWMLDVGCWMLDAGCWMLDAGCWMLDAGCWMRGARWEVVAAGGQTTRATILRGVPSLLGRRPRGFRDPGSGALQALPDLRALGGEVATTWWRGLRQRARAVACFDKCDAG